MTASQLYLVAGIVLAAFSLWRDYRYYVETPVLSAFMMTLIVVFGPFVCTVTVAVVLFLELLQPEVPDDH